MNVSLGHNKAVLDFPDYPLYSELAKLCPVDEGAGVLPRLTEAIPIQ